MNMAAALAQTKLQKLNRECDCYHIDRSTIDRSLNRQIENQSNGIARSLPLQDKEHLFARTAVFLGEDNLSQMQKTISAIETTVQLPGYRSAIAQRNNIALQALNRDKTRGLFMGYDFHLSPEGPRLIEINTNAGGGFLVQGLLTAVALDKPGASPTHLSKAELADPAGVANAIVNMFSSEWELGQLSLSQDSSQATSLRPLQHLAIVDQIPDAQYLYPDMLMAKVLLESRGINVSIVDPSDLSETQGRLFANGREVDMVYNRLTDFALHEPYAQGILRAHQLGTAVISPAPQHHGLYADKRNLTLLTGGEQLTQWGLDSKLLPDLDRIAATSIVTTDNADSLWQQRKKLFFKPASGYGSKAVYRGSKVTRKTWKHIVEAQYVAQQLVEPAQRQISSQAGLLQQLKYDIRVYAYAGKAIALAARAYRGQTTNFRTPGGGFAPVIVLPKDLLETYTACL